MFTNSAVKHPATASGGATGITLALGILFAFAVPFDPIPLLAGRTLAFPLGAALVASVCIDYLAGRRGGEAPSRFRAALGLYLSWILLTTFWSYDPGASASAAVQMFIRAAFVLSLCFLIPPNWRRLTTAYAWGAVALAILLLVKGEEQYVGRLTYMGADENAIGLSLTVGFAICLAKMTEERAVGTILYLALSFIIASATLATGSRTGLVALAVAVAVRLLSGRQRRRIGQTLLTGGALAASGAYFWQSGRVPERVVTFLEGSSIRDDSRTSIMELYYGHAEWMLFGTGLHADAAYLREKTGLFAYVHNLYLGTWVQLGVIGALLLIFLLITSVAAGWNSDRRDIWLSAAAPMFVYTMTLPGQTSNVYWFVIALGAATLGNPTDDTTEEKRQPGTQREALR